MITIGMDPSLTGFGLSVPGRGEHVFGTTPEDGTLDDRCSKICLWLQNQIPIQGPQTWVIEAAMTTSQGAGHLYEMGWLYCRLTLLARILERIGVQSVHFVMVPNSTLLKAMLGKGNMPKASRPLAVFKRYGREFDDRGLDKLHAFLLRRYGEMLEAGELEHKAPAKRGSGKHEKAGARKRERKRKGEA